MYCTLYPVLYAMYPVKLFLPPIGPIQPPVGNQHPPYGAAYGWRYPLGLRLCFNPHDFHCIDCLVMFFSRNVREVKVNQILPQEVNKKRFSFFAANFNNLENQVRV